VSRTICVCLKRAFAIFSMAAATVSTFAAEPLTWKRLASLPDALGVAAPFAGVSGDALLVAGGANFPGKMPWEGGRKVWHDRVWVLTEPEGRWRGAGQLARPLAYGVCVNAGDAVICAGGSDADRHYAEVFRLRWREGKLNTEALLPLPMTLSGASGAMVEGKLIVACGAERPGEQEASNRAFELDLHTPAPAWKELPRMPGKPRILAAGAAWGGRFFLFGGAALEKNAEGKIVRTYLRDAWSYEATKGWTRLADLPKPSVAAPSPAPVVNDRVLLIAGDDGSRVGFEPVEKHPGFAGGILAYDPKVDRWSEAGETPAPRATAPCVEWGGKFVIPSGEVRPGVRSPEVLSFMAR
jgi:N-acetylneuraminate epimerase